MDLKVCSNNYSIFIHYIIPTTTGISVKVTSNFSAPLMVGQTGNTLTCYASSHVGNLNSTAIYHWIRNNITILINNSSKFILSPLRLSDAGDYTCSILLNNMSVSAENNRSVVIESE